MSYENFILENKNFDLNTNELEVGMVVVPNTKSLSMNGFSGTVSVCTLEKRGLSESSSPLRKEFKRIDFLELLVIEKQKSNIRFRVYDVKKYPANSYCYIEISINRHKYVKWDLIKIDSNTAKNYFEFIRTASVDFDATYHLGSAKNGKKAKRKLIDYFMIDERYKFTWKPGDKSSGLGPYNTKGETTNLLFHQYNRNNERFNFLISINEDRMDLYSDKKDTLKLFNHWMKKGHDLDFGFTAEK